jgi:hypothetical protein
LFHDCMPHNVQSMSIRGSACILDGRSCSPRLRRLLSSHSVHQSHDRMPCL